jgi:hypothetical protein
LFVLCDEAHTQASHLCAMLLIRASISHPQKNRGQGRA